MTYQKPLMSRVALETEAAGCSPCVLLTVSTPAVSIDVGGNQVVGGIHADVPSQTIVVSPPNTSAGLGRGCPTAALPGTPTVGGLDGVQIPALRDLLGTSVPLPPGIVSITTLAN